MPHAVDRICRVGANSKDAYTYYPVVVVGAGESGICMGARLQQALGFDQFRIFERKGGLGGTWYTNTYPGIACDIPALLYSFSFAQNSEWTAPYPPGSEIVGYLYNVCNRFKLFDKIQCDTNIKSLRWIQSDEEWELILEHLFPGVGDMDSAGRQALEKDGDTKSTVLRLEVIRAKIVASAVGGLVEPKPNIDVPGLDTFQGKIVHTALWQPDVDLKGKHVAVLGTGCSAAQVMANLVKPEWEVKSLTQLLRSPPWVVPALASNDDSPGQLVPFLFKHVPGFQDLVRKIGFAVGEWDFLTHFPDTKRARKGRQATARQLLRYLRKRVPEKYQEILTPNYEVFCKRRVIDDGWFKALHDSRAEITSQPFTAAGPNSITIGPGRHYPPVEDVQSKAPTEKREIPCDVLIMANGYATNEWLHPLDVVGQNGKSLHEVWKQRGGAQAYLGTAMDGFPNFFMIFGPNTATGHTSVILATENMVNYSLKFIEPILKGDVKTWDIKESAEREWTRSVQKELEGSVFMSGGCRSWYYQADSKWNSTTYPWTQIDFTLRCMFPRWDHWNASYTRKGLVKLWLGRMYKTAIFVAMLTGVRLTYKHGSIMMLEKSRELFDLIKGILVDGIRKAGIAS